MIRLLIAILCALGLALSPVGVAHAYADPGMNMSNCPMQMAMATHEMHGMSPGKMHHGSMDCCSQACHAPTPIAVVVPIGIPEDEPVIETALFDAIPVKHLVSATGSTLDPPPRG